ncbi:MAG: prolipoprotein diacylglyceryl transferase [Planctomycetes bacterium]|nr:prolipoprotein diacylglyceryl transferase [Planctomycetota bacterium]
MDTIHSPESRQRSPLSNLFIPLTCVVALLVIGYWLSPWASPKVATFSAFVPGLGPFTFGSFQDVGVRWYGLAYLAGLVFGYFIVQRWSDSGRAPLRREEIQDFVLFSGLGMIVGGRVGYCLLYGWHDLVANPLYLFKVWDGGMASHGGIIGLAAGMAWFAHKRQRSVWVLADIIAVGGPLGIGFGRLANFINGELWGRPTEVSWAWIFPKSAPLPDDAPLALQIANAVPRHPSQLYAAVLEGFLLFAVLMWIHARHRRPGLTGAWFLILYGIGRFVGEFFREPDRGQPVFFGWMSKGQLYTLPMLIGGIALIIWVMRRPARPELYAAPAAPVPPVAPTSATSAPQAR